MPKTMSEDVQLKSDELVSIVVPVFNRAHAIKRSVGSLCSQSYRNIEILVVDDCSTDKIEEAVAALDDSRIRLVRRAKNGGASAARNSGLEAARGNLIAFHDSDDVCLFDKIERQVALLRSLSDDYIGVHTMVVFHVGVNQEEYWRMRTHFRPYADDLPLSGDLSERTLRGNSFNLPTLLVKKSALLAAGPSDELMRNNVDWDLALRLTRQGKLAFIPEPLYISQNHVSKAVKNQRISHSARYSAQSYVRITGKIRHTGQGQAYLPEHYNTTARKMLLIGRTRFARRFLAAALSLQPVSPKLWIQYLFSYNIRLRAGIKTMRDNFKNSARNRKNL